MFVGAEKAPRSQVKHEAPRLKRKFGLPRLPLTSTKAWTISSVLTSPVVIGVPLLPP
jgi:hypothetical protein